MILSELFDRITKKSPLPLMAWALLNEALSPQFVDALFERVSLSQYTRKLLFSDCVDLMSTVVTGVHKSIHAAFKARMDHGVISLASLYDKLNKIEPRTCNALVGEVSDRLRNVVDKLDAALPPMFQGYRTLILDGNAIGATDHRLKPLRETRSGPLPGKSLVILDPQYQFSVEMIPCEDAHTQERAMFDQVLDRVQANQAWIADRNFCTAGFIGGLTSRRAVFLIREHQKLSWSALNIPVDASGNKIREQRVRIATPDGEVLARRIIVKLEKPTRDGDREIVLITTIPNEIADAAAIAQAYRNRWTIENLFRVLTMVFRCEIPSLGYPRAALFAFSVALVASNVVATIRAAIRSAHGREQEEALSDFYLVTAIQRGFDGLQDGIGEDALQERATMSVEELIVVLLDCARNLELHRYRKAPTRPYRTKASRGKPSDPPHVSTARLLADTKRSP